MRGILYDAQKSPHGIEVSETQGGSRNCWGSDGVPEMTPLRLFSNSGTGLVVGRCKSSDTPSLNKSNFRSPSSIAALTCRGITHVQAVP